MVADTLLPEAYEVERVLTGPLVVAGFAISIALDRIWGPVGKTLRPGEALPV
jgi:hypothetical protein